jgi:hypothetical protein
VVVDGEIWLSGGLASDTAATPNVKGYDPGHQQLAIWHCPALGAASRDGGPLPGLARGIGVLRSLDLFNGTKWYETAPLPDPPGPPGWVGDKQFVYAVGADTRRVNTPLALWIATTLVSAAGRLRRACPTPGRGRGHRRGRPRDRRG